MVVEGISRLIFGCDLGVRVVLFIGLGLYL